jgi:hypothetical protein
MSKFPTGGSIKGAKEITGNFKCALCQREKYCPPEYDKQATIKINKTFLELLDEYEEVLPVTSDKYPANFVSWYNQDSKSLHSDQEFLEDREN